MGLFGRNQPLDNDDLDDIDLPSSNDLKPGLFPTDASVEPDEPIQPMAAASRPKGQYSIEDAIELMRQLPRENNEVVVTVVKKTLESTNIQVSDIIGDADNKETRIRNQHKTLEEEIKELEAQIAKRNQQIGDLLKDLKETTDVRERLQLALKLDKSSQPQAKAPEPKAESKPAAPNAPNNNANPNTPNNNKDAQKQPQKAGHRANL